MTKIRFPKTVLFGVGLIGASLVRDLKTRGLTSEIVGVDRSLVNAKLALKRGVVSRISRNVQADLQDADLVIFATPVRTIAELIRKQAQDIPKSALVIDVGSTKSAILKMAEKNFTNGNFVGAHPMAGTEKSGVAASLTGLFEKKICFLVSTSKTQSSFLKKAKALWRGVGAKVIECSSDEHDDLVSTMSHLPHAAAFALVSSLATGLAPKQVLAKRELLKTFAGGGFKDTTRVAASSPQMWSDIFLENAKPILRDLKKFQNELKHLEKAIAKKDEKRVIEILERASQIRQALNDVV